jgi:hypothetical protein
MQYNENTLDEIGELFSQIQVCLGCVEIELVRRQDALEQARREGAEKVAQGLEEHAEEELAVARYEGQCGWAQGFRRAAQRMQGAIREADDDDDVS